VVTVSLVFLWIALAAWTVTLVGAAGKNVDPAAR
jgi:hypothetical protein